MLYTGESVQHTYKGLDCSHSGMMQYFILEKRPEVLQMTMKWKNRNNDRSPGLAGLNDVSSTHSNDKQQWSWTSFIDSALLHALLRPEQLFVFVKKKKQTSC